MPQVRCDDANISYHVLGDGSPVVLLHPFPADHELWLPVAQSLTSRYRLILPDLRGHGSSDIGQGPATMEKHAADLARVMDDAEVGRVAIAGISIGGYISFELWRRFRGRIAALVLSNTKAQADTPEARSTRLRSADEVMEKGTAVFIDGMLTKVLGETTRRSRPDLVEGARRMMARMSPEDVSLVQKGMAERPDSTPILKTINIPTLILAGDEDTLTPMADAQLMHSNIPGSQMTVIPKAGHYATWEQPQDVGRTLRQFLDAVHGT